MTALTFEAETHLVEWHGTQRIPGVLTSEKTARSLRPHKPQQNSDVAWMCARQFSPNFQLSKSATFCAQILTHGFSPEQKKKKDAFSL